MGLRLWNPPLLQILRGSSVGLLAHSLSFFAEALSGCFFVKCRVYNFFHSNTQNAQNLMENSKMMAKQWLVSISGHHVQGLNDLVPVVCQMRAVAQLVEYLIALWEVIGSKLGVHNFLSVSGLCCFPFFQAPHDDLTYKKCSPQNYKRGRGPGGSKVAWVGPSWVGGSHIKYPPLLLNVARVERMENHLEERLLGGPLSAVRAQCNYLGVWPQ